MVLLWPVIRAERVGDGVLGCRRWPSGSGGGESGTYLGAALAPAVLLASPRSPYLSSSGDQGLTKHRDGWAQVNPAAGFVC